VVSSVRSTRPSTASGAMRLPSSGGIPGRFGERPGVTGLAVAGREMAVIGRRGALTPSVDTAAPAARVAMQRTVSCASDWGKPRIPERDPRPQRAPRAPGLGRSEGSRGPATIRAPGRPSPCRSSRWWPPRGHVAGTLPHRRAPSPRPIGHASCARHPQEQGLHQQGLIGADDGGRTPGLRLGDPTAGGLNAVGGRQLPEPLDDRGMGARIHQGRTSRAADTSPDKMGPDWTTSASQPIKPLLRRG
jgi:hypothetical protein